MTAEGKGGLRREARARPMPRVAGSERRRMRARYRLGAKLAPLEPIELDAHGGKLALGTARGAAPFALPHPGRHAADDDAGDHHRKQQPEQRQRHREGRMRVIEGIERDTTAARLATAKMTSTTASGTRTSAVTILRIDLCRTHGRRGAIEPLAHFLAGLEERHRLSSPPRHARQCAGCVRCGPGDA